MKMPTAAADQSAGASADPAADPSAADAGGSGDTAPQGYTIEIMVAADGTITVDVEQGADDSDESGEGAETGGDTSTGGDADAGSPTPAKNIKDALSIALDIYRNSGEIAAATTAPADDMQAGYGG